ncbi:hypothetical protein A33Q_1700 [Indibacter alkaliphilus LW1]|uniref:DUF4920 domain-containing protein n=1 Tax=Indibacter alkaliphilus (strain CCUG 57479 / KCTC 22604 / LW1) TaxID=1189612 RepID=S2DF39_INDAL|nr:DUF4920 domain-containing protein [Indibacter alkaliphilus]EOZ97727.1 hypothetical protein A33Q_1700 [Indibacter alkaliphilus LW1]
MKKSILIIGMLAVGFFSCQEKKSNESEALVGEELISNTPVGVFGAVISEEEITPLSNLVAQLEEGEEFHGKVMGEIREVCAHKGCWMTMDLPNGETMRVTFKDYGFFVPKNSQGYPVIIEGVASKKITDVETLRHYAEDAGKSKEEIEAITEPKNEYAFEAVGVIIQENA